MAGGRAGRSSWLGLFTTGSTGGWSPHRGGTAHPVPYVAVAYGLPAGRLRLLPDNPAPGDRTSRPGPRTQPDLRCYVVGATGFEPVTSSVSANTGKRCARSRSPRSPPTVDAQRKRSLDVKGNALPAHHSCVLDVPGVGGAGPRLTRLAWGGHDPGRRAATAGAAPSTPPPPHDPRRWSTSLSPLPPNMHRREPASAGSTRSGTPPAERTPSLKPLRSSTRPRWTGTQTVCAGRGQPADDGRGRWLFDSSW